MAFLQPKLDIDACKGASSRARRVHIPAPRSETLEAKMVRGGKERFVEFLTVTPAMAAKLLAVNGPLGKRNRPIRRSQVEKHKERLQDGSFMLTHQGLAITWDARLADGQTRLTAISETGIGALMTVTFGCDPAEFSATDVGTNRSPGNLLAIDGCENSDTVAAIAGLMIMLSSGRHAWDGKAVLDWVRENNSRQLNELHLREAVSVGSRTQKVTNPAAAGSAAFLILSATATPGMIAPFFEQLAKGVGRDKHVAALRDALMPGGDLHRGNGQSTSIRRIGAIINTWNFQFKKDRKKAPVIAWDKLSTTRVERAL